MMTHIEDQNWFAVWLDLLIVVLGVFLGIQLGNWNDDRILKASAIQSRQELVEDIRRDIATFSVRQEFYTDVLRSALSVESKLATLPEDMPEAQWPFIMNVQEAGFMWPLEPSGLVYKELKNEGTLGLVADPALQKDLRDYYEDASAELGVTIRFQSDFRQNSRRLIDGPIHVHIAEKCDAFAAAEPSTPLAYTSQFFAECATPEDLSSISKTYQRILGAPKLADDLRLRISEISQTLGFLSSLETQATELIAELDAQ